MKKYKKKKCVFEIARPRKPDLADVAETWVGGVKKKKNKSQNETCKFHATSVCPVALDRGCG